MRVIAIRNAVYIGEQECPYDEEYDGNDLSATHLLAYMGDEPVGCLRVRFFADFAKIERLGDPQGIPQDPAPPSSWCGPGFKLCQKKGYRRVYGHSQTRLVNFWSRFGFRVMEGAQDVSSFPISTMSKWSPNSSRIPMPSRSAPIPMS